MKADLHCHTAASKDSLSSLQAIFAGCRRAGIDCLAITDHNRLTHVETTEIRIIPAEEIMTTAGEIIGLFLSQEVPAGLTPSETIARIKAQGGIVYLPHPFDHFRRSSRLDPAALREIAPQVDAVEGRNARNLLSGDDRRAQAWAAKRDLPLGAGSDAHTPNEIGTAYVELDDFDSPASFLASLRGSRIAGRNSPFWVHFFSSWAKWSRRVKWTKHS
jgi:predicted metal-dependent phosphoesterase TrpH